MIGGAVAIAAVLVGARRLRRRLLPTWNGAAAGLVDAIVVLATFVVTAQVLAAFGWFRPWPMLAAAVVAGGAMALVGSGRGPSTGSAPVDRRELAVALVGVAVMTTQWVAKTANTVSTGMTNPDTLLYHGPLAARFLQTGSFTDTAGLGTSADRYYPHNAEVVHALVAMPFQRDFLSPLVNLGWVALGLTAAWCIGRRVGAGGLAVLGACAVVGLPAVASSNPGQESNDVMTAALVLAALAILLEGEFGTRSTALAAVAAGLAVGTRLIAIFPVAALTVGVVVLAARRRQPGAAVWWVGVVGALGSYWLLRNWAAVDNPLPWYGIELGPLSFDAVAPQPAGSVANYVTDGDTWREYFLPGLSRGLGWSWPLVLLLGVGVGVSGLRHENRGLRVAAGAALVALVGYVFTPLERGGRGPVVRVQPPLSHGCAARGVRPRRGGPAGPDRARRGSRPSSV